MANVNLAKVGETVIARTKELQETGMVLPKDYNYVNAVKASIIKLNELRAFEKCTEESIQTALFQMVTKGLNIALNQGYAIIRGNKLCIDDSYFGKILQVKRIFPYWDANVVIVREGDVFEIGIKPENGRKFIKRHETALDNLDKDFLGAYIYVPCSDGGNDLYIMTKKQILTAWSKSSTSQGVHKMFQDKMITKTVINSACTKIINGNPMSSMVVHESENLPLEEEQQHENGEFIVIDNTNEEEVIVEDNKQVDIEF